MYTIKVDASKKLICQNLTQQIASCRKPWNRWRTDSSYVWFSPWVEWRWRSLQTKSLIKKHAWVHRWTFFFFKSTSFEEIWLWTLEKLYGLMLYFGSWKQKKVTHPNGRKTQHVKWGDMHLNGSYMGKICDGLHKHGWKQG